VQASLCGHTGFAHLLAPRARCLRLVEAAGLCLGDRYGVIRWRQLASVAGLAAGLAEEVAVQDRLVEGVCRGREAFLVTWMRIDLQEELEDLCDRAAFSFVGLLGVEVQQEPPQTVAASALRSDVVVHPRAGVAHRREAPAGQHEEGGGAPRDLSRRHPAPFERPGPKRQASRAAGRQERVGAHLRHPDLVADAPAHAPAEHHPKDRHIPQTGEHLQPRAEHEPRRVGVREPRAQPVEPRKQRHHRHDDEHDPGQEQQLLAHLSTTQLLGNLQVVREDARRHAGSEVEASTTHPAGSVWRVPCSTSMHSSTAARPGRCRL
jgi:hypothetical protein